ncbi:MAG: YqgE/AlgH family protein [Paracoccus sp. (in: a-proteobacteria)]|nr:YqgE/AlgH family protein [Paracoccus sp. (in: a-proteobacteria)]
MNPDNELTGKILIAMPDMGDPRFARSVVLICAHSDEGAMGIVLNHPLHELSFGGLLEMLGIAPAGPVPGLPLRQGGPVEPGRGFVLHSARPVPQEDAMHVGSGLELTTTRDILIEIAEGNGPERAVLALGYAGWGPDQLDGEIRANGWLIGDMNPEYAFGPPDDVWRRALAALGVDPLTLSGAAGRA